MKGKSIAALAAVMVSMGTVTAYAAPSHVTEKSAHKILAATSSESTLTIGISADPPNLDPSQSSSLYDRDIMFNVYDTLFQITPQNKIIGDLVQSWTISPDGKTYTLHLHQGIKFQDGTPFNAAAVKFNFERNMQKTSARATDLAAVSSVSTSGDYTVTIHLKQAYSPLLSILSDRAGMMVSPTAATKEGANLTKDPVGTGPYKFKERVIGDHITLVRFPGYWHKGVNSINTVVYKVFTDPNVEVANLESGAVDMIDAVPSSQLQSLESNKSFVVSNHTGLGYQGFYLNDQTAPFNNQDLREAVSDAIDRAALVQVAEKGVATPGSSPFSSASPVYSKSVDAPIAPNSATVKKLLKAGGEPNGFSFTFQTANNPVSVQIAQVIQSMLQQYGIQMTIDQLDYGTLLANSNKHAFQANQLGWSGRFDPDQNFAPFLVTNGSQNDSGYSNKTVDKLDSEAVATSDIAKRSKLYAEMMNIIHEQAPYVYLFHQNNVYAYSTKVHGFQYTSDGVIHVSGITVSK